MDHEERLRRLKEIGERAEREAIERNRAPCLERVIVKLVNGIFECLPILRRQFPGSRSSSGIFVMMRTRRDRVLTRCSSLSRRLSSDSIR